MINLVGIALGISSCVFIGLFVIDEFSYDSHHQYLDRIFRATTEITSENSVDHVAISPSAVASALKENYPEVVAAVRFSNMGTETTIKQGDNLYKEKNVFKADSNVFQVFSYKMIKGDPDDALTAPQRVVLTKSIAEKYFGSGESLGKTLMISRKDYLITGVMEDVPMNSDFRFTMLASMDTSDYSDDWFDFSYIHYVLFDDKSVRAPGFISSFEKKITELVDDKMNRPLRENKQNTTCSIHFQPLKGIHFQSSLLYDTPKGNKNYSYIFSCVAVLILIIGCLNYTNFSIVQSIERSKEVGIRKVVGAAFSQLIVRYISESMLFTALAVLLAGIITALMMPAFNELTERNFTVLDLFNGKSISIVLVMLFVVGIVAGSYPAFYTSSIKPVQALKGKVTTPKGQIIRRISISSQFFISIGLLICTGIVYRQMIFIKRYDLGFKKDNAMVIKVPSDSSRYEKFQFLKESLLKSASVKSVALGGLGALPGAVPELGSATLKTDGKDDVRMVSYNAIDEDYLPSLGIGITQGRNFDGRLSDFKNSILVNEALVRMMGWDNPLAQQVAWKDGFKNVIGVVRDFHFRSLYNKVEPQVIGHHGKEVSYVFVVFSGLNFSDQIESIRNEWGNLFPDEPLDYTFLDESVNAQYRNEEKAMRVFTYFSALTIIISFLGLFGLTSLTVYQRKKEIGIRKIIGAEFLSILLLFAKEYLGLIIISIVLVSPVSWFVMNRWLESFPYRDSISLFIFMGTGIGVIAISLMTIAFSISRIAKSKPVNLIAEN